MNGAERKASPNANKPLTARTLEGAGDFFRRKLFHSFPKRLPGGETVKFIEEQNARFGAAGSPECFTNGFFASADKFGQQFWSLV